MGSVRVIFSRGHSLGSLLLRAFQWSSWSHCGIVDGDRVIEAKFGRGVVETPIAEFLAKSSAVEEIEIPAAFPGAVRLAARAEVGKPYDWPGVLGIALRRKWQEVDSWFCSELVAHAFKAAGTPLFRTDAWRITPRDLNIRAY